MTRPTPDAMRAAAEWLDVNEGELGEMEECRSVAAWLRAEADAMELRSLCRERGVYAHEARALRDWLTKVLPADQ